MIIGKRWDLILQRWIFRILDAHHQGLYNILRMHCIRMLNIKNAEYQGWTSSSSAADFAIVLPKVFVKGVLPHVLPGANPSMFCRTTCRECLARGTGQEKLRFGLISEKECWPYFALIKVHGIEIRPKRWIFCKAMRFFVQLFASSKDLVDHPIKSANATPLSSTTRRGLGKVPPGSQSMKW